jgi:hypothetical protein
LILALGLVIEVSFLETGAYINAEAETVMGFMRGLGGNGFENAVSAHVVLTLRDDSIADFTDEYNQTSWSVVIG